MSRTAKDSARRPGCRLRPSLECLEGRELLSASPGPLPAQDPALADYRIQVTGLPNDPKLSDQWFPNNPGGGGGKVDADIDATDAWGVFTGTARTTVAVIDTGIDYRHRDLYRNIWINQREIPTAVRSKLTDTDGDGLITFWDLN